MANPPGEPSGEFPRLNSDRRLMLQRGGSVVTSSLFARQRDDALGLTMIAEPEWPMRLSGLALPLGTKVWPRRFPAGPNVVSQQQRRSVMLKTLALSAAVLAFASGLAFAETTMTESHRPDARS